MRGTWARFTLASSCFWAYLSWEGRASLFTNGITNTGKHGCLKQLCRFQLFFLPYSVFKTTRTSKFKRRPTIGFKVLSIVATKATKHDRVTSSSLGQTGPCPIILQISAVVVMIDSSLKSQTLVDVLTSQLA